MPTLRAVRLTKEIIAKASATGPGPVWLRDVTTRGLAVCVYPSGRKAFKYECKLNGRTIRVSLGDFNNPLSLEAARAKCAELQVLRAGKVDPRREVTQPKNRTVEAVLEDYLLRGPASKPHKRLSSWQTDASVLRCHVVPLLGTKAVRDLTKESVAIAYDAIRTGKHAVDLPGAPRGRRRIRGGAGVLPRVHTAFKAALNWAVAEGELDHNPLATVRLQQPDGRQSVLSATELHGLLDVLSGPAAPVKRDIAEAIVLLALTGARKAEITGLRWSEVHFDKGEISLPHSRSKTGARTIFLSKRATTLLRMRHERIGGDRVFPNTEGGTLRIPHKEWGKVRTLIGRPELRIHDLRHTFGTLLAAQGESMVTVASMLGHSKITTTQRYAHPMEKQAKEAASKLAELVGG